MINLTEKTISLFSKKTKGKILQESLLLFNEQTFNQTNFNQTNFDQRIF